MMKQINNSDSVTIIVAIKYRFRLDVKGRHLDTWKLFALSNSVHVLPLDVTSPRDSYAWNDRELGTLLTLSESLA